MLPVDPGTAQPASSDGRATVIAGFAFGLALVVLIAGLVLAFGSPAAWPNGVKLVLQQRQGEQVYNANCLSCHLGPTGGTIADDPPRHNANGHTWHHPDCALTTMIREGSAGIFERSNSAVPMPPFKDLLSPDDTDAVIAHIKTMWTPAQRQAQANFTREMCFEGSAQIR
jgi:mono/diheme cytochrome c family protein